MFKQKNVCMIISVALAIIWLLFSVFAFADTSSGLNSADDAEVIGTGLALAMVMPYLVIAAVGTLLHTIGGIVYKRGLTLAGLIVECASILFMITWGFGYLVVAIFGFIGYAKMPKKASA